MNTLKINCRCIHKDQNPCSMGLCEQHCTVYMQRIICTCFDGYKFSAENQRNGITPACVGKLNAIYYDLRTSAKLS